MKEIIERYQIKAKKSLGQNFLMDENILNEIVGITNIENENILEVGPGFGALTGKILYFKPASLTLVELDTTMINILQDRIENNDLKVNKTTFELLHQDVLKFTPNFQNYKVIANIPYYITSPILSHFLYDVPYSPKEMIILIQKEVGDRILSKKSSVLSLFVQKKCTITEEIYVPSKAFSPPPKVDSSVLFFKKHFSFDQVGDKEFLAFIKAAFLNPRKKMINNLASKGYSKDIYLSKILELGFNENVRAEDLSINDYIVLLSNN